VAPSNSLQLARQWTALHGITTDPTTQQIRPGVTRTFWGKPGAPPAVELWALADTGHVYPTEPIAAATEIARSWGLI
jgi:poly(3-hydroxybutyrate) depolymerase